jgi:hypothetical protein
MASNISRWIYFAKEIILKIMNASHNNVVSAVIAGVAGGVTAIYISHKFFKKHGRYLGLKQCPNCGYYFNSFFGTICSQCEHSLVITETNPTFSDRVENVVGKTILIGLSYENPHGDIVDRKQLYGKIIEVSPKKGIGVLLNKSDEVYYLPPRLSLLDAAPPGEYRLVATGETISNPDFLSNWIVNKPQ